MVSNFQRYKGILEYIDAANICINEKKLDIDFCIYGASYQDGSSIKDLILNMLGFRESLEQIIKDKIFRYQLIDKLTLQGYVFSPNEIYNNIDLLIFPSYLNAVGRPVFEAAFYRVPSIVAVKNAFSDTIVNNETGVCIDEKNPKAIAEAIEALYSDNKFLLSLGEKSYDLANTLYSSEKNANTFYALYKDLVEKDKNVQK